MPGMMASITVNLILTLARYVCNDSISGPISNNNQDGLF